MKRYFCATIATIGTVFAAFFLFPSRLAAQEKEQKDIPRPAVNAQAAVLIDGATGALLFNKNGDHAIPPASLAKLMTIHIALNEVAEGRASLDDTVDLPRQTWAVSQPPRSSLMYLASGQTVTLRELLLGLAIPSGNDAAVAVALHFAPTVEAFAERMNQEARWFGLSATRFVEPSGISEFNTTTALEFAFFCREYLKIHPEALADYHSVKEFVYPKEENWLPAYRGRMRSASRLNNNNLLGTFEGVDGLKTGYIDESGYNIAITAERRGTRFIAVILGAPSIRARDEDGRSLLSWGFDHFKTLRPEPAPLTPARVWKGKRDDAEISVEKSLLEFTTFTERGHNLRWETELADPIIAPLPAHSEVGMLVLYDSQGELERFPLTITGELERGGFLKRLWDAIRLFFRSLKD
ncbi:MAG: D-alanyl-D-alanine carboxypeptidase [Spirochaetaceae bacterium]|jgi:D-alanyl-D-alanine carboxypeptidase (penicillin-binding protein 5/6)|nr:D-alanyl-D-alanine carboxypeptidase [Spirochaetaceae bacterium]